MVSDANVCGLRDFFVQASLRMKDLKHDRVSRRVMNAILTCGGNVNFSLQNSGEFQGWLFQDAPGRAAQRLFQSVGLRAGMFKNRVSAADGMFTLREAESILSTLDRFHEKACDFFGMAEADAAKPYLRREQRIDIMKTCRHEMQRYFSIEQDILSVLQAHIMPSDQRDLSLILKDFQGRRSPRSFGVSASEHPVVDELARRRNGRLGL